MTSASPATFANHNPNVYYADDPEEFLQQAVTQNRQKYIEAITEVMRREYEAIADAGIVLQLDCPDLGASRWTFFANLSDEEFLKIAEFHIEALNHATRSIPRELKRMHVCWGAGEGPHNHDVPLETLAPILVKAEVGAISFVAANGRHAHEWKVWRDVRIPDGVKLIPGVIDSTTNIVEHPEWVADRILQYAEVVGVENLVAGVDCGFGPIARASLGVSPTGRLGEASLAWRGREDSEQPDPLRAGELKNDLVRQGKKRRPQLRGLQRRLGCKQAANES